MLRIPGLKGADPSPRRVTVDPDPDPSPGNSRLTAGVLDIVWIRVTSTGDDRGSLPRVGELFLDP
jgi:hypothetical protein